MNITVLHESVSACIIHAMTDYDAPCETADELLGAIGGRFAKVRLARWHRWGLIPRPVGRRFLGRGKGSVTLYPPGTKAQLLRVRELLRHDRRAAHAIWQLWREGYPVPIDRIRAFLHDIAQQFDRGIQILKHGSHLSKRFWQYLDGVGDARLKDPILRRTRRRVGKARFPTLVRILAEVVTGTFVGWQPVAGTGAADMSDRDILEKGAGLERARIDRVGNAGPWLSRDTADDLRALSRAIAAAPLREVLADTPDEELLQARADLNILLSRLNALSVLSEGLLGRGAFGFGRIREFASASPLGQGFFLLIWLALRREQTNIEAFNAFVRGSAEWLPHVASAEALQQLRAELPEVAKLLSYRRCRTALRDPAAMGRLQAELKAFSDTNKEPIRAFFARHPEYRQIDVPAVANRSASAEAPAGTAERKMVGSQTLSRD